MSLIMSIQKTLESSVKLGNHYRCYEKYHKIYLRRKIMDVVSPYVTMTGVKCLIPYIRTFLKCRTSLNVPRIHRLT